MILFLRTSEVSIDSRMLRFARALGEAGIAHAAAYWARGEQAAGADPIPAIRHRARVGRGGRMAVAIGIARTNLFLMKTLWHIRRQVSLVHAVDLDTAITAWIMHRLTGLPYLYDIYDHYADSRGLTGRARRWLEAVEARVVRDAAGVILAHPSRRAQHGPIPPDKLLIVENVPSAEQQDVPPAIVTGQLRIGYLGTFEPRFRGLEDLIAVVEGDPRLTLEIAGTGALGEVIAAAAGRCPRIILHPPLAHEAGLAMLARCDIMAGLYYADVPNHRFAAPNKYYEHLLIGRPLLTSRDTPPGAKVIEHDTGWAVADGAAGIARALAQALAEPDLLAVRGRKAAALWRSHYAGYHASAIRGDYVARARHAARALHPTEGDAVPCLR